MQNEDRFEILESWLKREKNINLDYIKAQCASKNLLDYLEKEHNGER